MIHVFEEPVVRFSRGQHSHPAKLVCNPLLQEGNSTGACHNGFKDTLVAVSNIDSSRCFLIATHIIEKLQLFVPNWLVRMMSLASREDGEGLLRAKR